MANAFSRPILSILITRSSPSRAQLGTINGANQALTALCRSLGPSIAGLVYSMSLEVGKPWIVWRLGLFIWASGLFIAGWFLTDPETKEVAEAVYAPLPQAVAVEERHRSEERSSAEVDANTTRYN
jgi:MFS family permease